MNKKISWYTNTSFELLHLKENSNNKIFKYLNYSNNLKYLNIEKFDNYLINNCYNSQYVKKIKIKEKKLYEKKVYDLNSSIIIKKRAWLKTDILSKYVSDFYSAGILGKFFYSRKTRGYRLPQKLYNYNLIFDDPYYLADY